MSSVNMMLLSEALELLLQVELTTSSLSINTFTKDQDTHHVCYNTSVICCTITNMLDDLAVAAGLENISKSLSSNCSLSSSEEVSSAIITCLFFAECYFGVCG
jgi:hypothetical protein